jgi:7-carboxy-7-deazaguanine synthase
MVTRLRIAEVFVSVQGEGQWLGVPSTFVRVSGCNLRCAWCDTPYASWRPEGPVEAVAELVERVHALGQRHVVVTGGEPMLFDGIEPLVEGLKGLGHVITIETAGTVYRPLSVGLMSISPKLANSRPDEALIGAEWVERHERLRRDLVPLRKLVGENAYQLKFVVTGAPSDVEEIEQILEAIGPVEAERVFLMAEGVDSATLHGRERMLVPLCLERGWRLAPRFHIDLFGDRRGT